MRYLLHLCTRTTHVLVDIGPMVVAKFYHLV